MSSDQNPSNNNPSITSTSTSKGLGWGSAGSSQNNAANSLITNNTKPSQSTSNLFGAPQTTVSTNTGTSLFGASVATSQQPSSSGIFANKDPRFAGFGTTTASSGFSSFGASFVTKAPLFSAINAPGTSGQSSNLNFGGFSSMTQPSTGSVLSTGGGFSGFSKDFTTKADVKPVFAASNLQPSITPASAPGAGFGLSITQKTTTANPPTFSASSSGFNFPSNIATTGSLSSGGFNLPSNTTTTGSLSSGGFNLPSNTTTTNSLSGGFNLPSNTTTTSSLGSGGFNLSSNTTTTSSLSGGFNLSSNTTTTSSLSFKPLDITSNTKSGAGLLQSPQLPASDANKISGQASNAATLPGFSLQPNTSKDGASILSRIGNTQTTAFPASSTAPVFGVPKLQATASTAPTKPSSSIGSTSQTLGAFRPSTSSTTTSATILASTTSSLLPSTTTVASTTSSLLPNITTVASTTKSNTAATTTTLPTSATVAVTTGVAASATKSAPPIITPVASTSEVPAWLKDASISDMINRWSKDLADCQQTFINQATEVGEWDRKVVENNGRVVHLVSQIDQANAVQKSIDLSLAAFEQKQQELEQLLQFYEAKHFEIPKENKADKYREKSYSLAETINKDLDKMSQQLSAIITDINRNTSVSGFDSFMTADGENDAVMGDAEEDAVDEVVKILNAHLISLQWIDQTASQMSARLQEAQAMLASAQNLNRQEERRGNSN